MRKACAYPIIHLKGEDIEMTLTHGNAYGEEYYSFVNGQYTTQWWDTFTSFQGSILNHNKRFF